MKMMNWLTLMTVVVISISGCSKADVTTGPSAQNVTGNPVATSVSNQNPDPIRRYVVWDARAMQSHFFEGDDSVWIDADWHAGGMLGPRYVETRYGTTGDARKPAITAVTFGPNQVQTPTFPCPQDIGHIAITAIDQTGPWKWMLLHFISTTGVTGTFNLQTHQWTLSPATSGSTFVNIDPVESLQDGTTLSDFFGDTSAWIDGDWYTSGGGFGPQYVATNMVSTKANSRIPEIRMVYMNRGPQDGYFNYRTPLVDVFPCPRPIGQIKIIRITNGGMLVWFEAAKGVRGTWNIGTHVWSFEG